MSDRRNQVKDWYDGFTFGDRNEIYNPWSIINFLEERKVEAYWANTSTNGLVGKLIREGKPNIKQDFEALLKGEVLHVEIDEQIVYNHLAGRKNAIWSLLLASGYLKVVRTEFAETTGRRIYHLALTNREVSFMMENMIHDRFSPSNDDYNDFVKALLLGDVDAMNEYMNRVSETIFSSFDTEKKTSRSEPERFYHGFVLELMVELSGQYAVTSNRESGFGRYDVMLEPLYPGRDDGIILEFKVFQPKRERNLEDTVKAALKQIEEKKYDSQLITKGISEERIHSYGLAFRGKEVLIGGK